MLLFCIQKRENRLSFFLCNQFYTSYSVLKYSVPRAAGSYSEAQRQQKRLLQVRITYLEEWLLVEPVEALRSKLMQRCR
jgi:hypothetical protein